MDSRYQSIGAAKAAGTLGTVITGNLQLRARPAHLTLPCACTQRISCLVLRLPDAYKL